MDHGENKLRVSKPPADFYILKCLNIDLLGGNDLYTTELLLNWVRIQWIFKSGHSFTIWDLRSNKYMDPSILIDFN